MRFSRSARERRTVGLRWDQPNRSWAVRAHARLTGVHAMVDRGPPLGRGGRGLGGRSYPSCLSFGGLLTPGAPKRSSGLWWISACACVILSTYG